MKTIIYLTLTLAGMVSLNQNALRHYTQTVLFGLNTPNLSQNANLLDT